MEKRREISLKKTLKSLGAAAARTSKDLDFGQKNGLEWEETSYLKKKGNVRKRNEGRYQPLRLAKKNGLVPLGERLHRFQRVAVDERS